jgi:hypothetical protein
VLTSGTQNALKSALKSGTSKSALKSAPQLALQIRHSNGTQIWRSNPALQLALKSGTWRSKSGAQIRHSTHLKLVGTSNPALKIVNQTRQLIRN